MGAVQAIVPRRAMLLRGKALRTSVAVQLFGGAGAACRGPPRPTRPKPHRNSTTLKLEVKAGLKWCDAARITGVRRMLLTLE